ncbi:MAG TPA: TRAP transporter large permease [Thermoplasmatales archaeon]|nr:TRAP transporter large permease [Thermoplasmatales archaeon]
MSFLDITLVFSVLFGLLILGVPVAFSIGLSSLLAFYLSDAWQIVSVITQRMYSGALSFILLAVPFYIFAGFLMNAGGMTRRITEFAQMLVGRFTGGLGHVNVLASMLFAGMSGSSVADASGLGSVEIEMMTNAGYDKRFSAAITAASATIGPVVPPSIPFVIYGAMTGVSVGGLFLGGFTPGVLMGIALMVAVYFISRKRNYPKVVKKYKIKEMVLLTLNGLLGMGSIVIIIGGILSGIFTPTEAGVVACLYALFIGFFVFRELKIKDLIRILWETAQSSVRILFIIAVASAYSYALTLMRVPEIISSALGNLIYHPYLLLFIINLILLLLGCFMETISIMLLVVPILIPIARQAGIDLLHLGVMMTLNLMIGQITPPVGVLLYSVASVSKLSLQDIITELWPYIIALLCVLFVTTYLPSFTLWLPKLVSP